ncbi:MAG: nucleotide exchange factor GrpE [Anaerolineales bacterium]|nr:nucleotide exchange factor GrpE [Anaerolineales bacterium]
MQNLNAPPHKARQPELEEITPENDAPSTIAQLEQLQEEVNTWKDKYLRLYADLDNTKRRLRQQSTIQVEQQKKQLLRDFLPLADNLERALQHASGDFVEQGLRHGVEITLKMFVTSLAQNGVTPIEAWHQPFDPDIHEAIGFLPRANLPPGMVAQVEQTGYMLDGSLLRSAKVLITPG